MPNNSFTDHVRALITQNKLSEALAVLRDLTANSPQLNRVLLQQKRFAEILQEKYDGLIAYEAANVETNRIAAGLLALLSHIDGAEQQPMIKAEVDHFAAQYVQKNVLNNSSVSAGANAIIGDGNTFNQYVQSTDPTIPRYLTAKPFVSTYFIGREAELAAIDADYQRNNRLLVLVNGEGGIGKTTLAAHYWEKNETRYQYLAWLYADSGIGDALLRLAPSLNIQFSPQDGTAAKIAQITEGVARLSGRCLLVFDNANDAADLKRHFMVLHQLPNCHILLTSRVTALGDTPVHHILPLSAQKAVELFIKHYPKRGATSPQAAQQEAALLNSILHAVGYNTLVIELLAKNLAVFNQFQHHYPLSDLLIDLQKKGLLALKSKPVDTVYQSNTLREATPEAIIEAMYDVSALSAVEKRLLSHFAVLPAENIPFDTFNALLKPEPSDAFEAPLSSLAQKGWLEYRSNENDFKISPVVQAIIRHKNKKNLLNDNETLIHSVIEQLHPDITPKDNYKHATLLAHYAETVVETIEEPNFNVAVLCERIGVFYSTMGDLEKTVYFYEKDIDITKQLCTLYPDDTNFKNGLAISYQNLGNTQADLGNLDAALTFYKDCNHLEKELYANFPNNVAYKNGLAISYSKLGDTQAALGNLDAALTFYEKDIELSKKLYADFPNNVTYKNGLAVSYQNLGITQTALGNLDAALTFYENYNRLEKELHADFSNNVEYKNLLAISYQYLGRTQAALGNLDAALTFYNNYNCLREELYVAFPNNVEYKNGLALSYQWLGWFYENKLNDGEKAKPFYYQSEQLLIALSTSFPLYAAFKKNLAWVQDRLAAL